MAIEDAKLWLKTRITRSALIRIALATEKSPSRTGEMPALDQLSQILVIRGDGIGDFILMIPFLRELRRSAPKAKICLAVIPAVFDLASRCPYVDQVVALPTILTRTKSSIRRFLAARRFAKAKLRPFLPQLAINTRWDIDYQMISFLMLFSGAPWRWGYSEYVYRERHRHDFGLDRLLSRALDSRGVQHELHRNLEFLRELGGSVNSDKLEIWTNQDDRAAADRVFLGTRIDFSRPVLACCIGAGQPKRQWPLQFIAEVGRWCIDELGAQLILVGGPQDWAPSESLCSSLARGVTNMAGTLSMPQLAALLARCSLYLGNDTGPSHLAAAAGIPIVVVSCHPATGSVTSNNSGTRFAPRSDRLIWLQPERPMPPCREECSIVHEPHCIRGVTAEQVKRAIQELLSSSTRAH